MATNASKVTTTVIPHRANLAGKCAAKLIWLIIKLVSSTIRFKLSDSSGVLAKGDPGPLIFAIWHNRLALCIPIYDLFVRQRFRNHRLAAMVSASRDGAILSEILRMFKVASVRGSSSRRGPQALLELSTMAENGFDLAITPDGPRGPRYKVQEGPIWLAQITGIPVLPVSYKLYNKKVLKSWDGFQIPLPFTMCEIFLGPAIFVPKDLSEKDLELKVSELQSSLDSITFD